MSEWQPTEEEVAAVVAALKKYIDPSWSPQGTRHGHRNRPLLDRYQLLLEREAADALAAVGPAIAARALREAADGLEQLDRSSVVVWLRSRAAVIDPPALVSDDKERG
jgi:hypothetical protein